MTPTHNQDIAVHRLPVSWRLPSSAAPTIVRTFHPFTHFTAGTGEDTRGLEFPTTALARADLHETLAQAFTTGWALHELPHRHVPRTDTQMTAVFTANGQMAFGIIRAPTEHVHIVPEDMSVIGFDDVRSPHTSPGCSRPCARPSRLRRHAGKLGRLCSPRIDPHLVTCIRDSKDSNRLNRPAELELLSE
ncbi:substrate-binding domain-containing protein [Streptomyces sp. NPDC090073]|uniref:substrate-binding domain-containing protein n=1 Tax=Streptomyces sp. NPDC090073 TaxID=3365936 RepID=UPI003814E3C6